MSRLQTMMKVISSHLKKHADNASHSRKLQPVIEKKKKRAVISVGLFMSSKVPHFLLNILQTKPIPKQGAPLFVFIGRFSRDSLSSIWSFLPQNHKTVSTVRSHTSSFTAPLKYSILPHFRRFCFVMILSRIPATRLAQVRRTAVSLNNCTYLRQHTAIEIKPCVFNWSNFRVT